MPLHGGRGPLPGLSNRLTLLCWLPSVRGIPGHRGPVTDRKRRCGVRGSPLPPEGQPSWPFGYPDRCGPHRRRPTSARPRLRRRRWPMGRLLQHDGQPWATNGRAGLGRPWVGYRPARFTEADGPIPVAARVGRTHSTIDVSEGLQATWSAFPANRRTPRPRGGSGDRGVHLPWRA
jgi:hypothetical protein